MYQCRLVKVICYVEYKRNITLSCWVPIYRDRLCGSISFLFSHLMRSLDFAWDDKNPTFPSAPLSCWASRSIYLPLTLVVFLETALCHAFLLRCNAFPLLFGKCMVCIAPDLRILMFYKYYAPTVREALFVVRETIVMLSASETSHGVD